MPNPKLRGIADLSTSAVLTILLAVSAAALLGIGGMWAYGEMQKADHMRIQALMQAQAVLDGDVFAVQFNQPVVVEQIGYGWYDGRTGLEAGVQFRDVGSSGRHFSWRLDRPDYNLTYVIAKDPNSGVRKIFRWRFVRLSPETQAAMAAHFSDVFSKQYASQYANQYAQQYAQQYAAQYAQQIQQQLQDYIDRVIQQQLGPGVSINNNPGSGPNSNSGGGGSNGGGSGAGGGGSGGGGGGGDYVAYVTVKDTYGSYVWRVSSSVDSFEVHGSVYSRPIKLGGPTDTLRIDPVEYVLSADFLSCRMEPTATDAVAGGHYTFTYVCTPVPRYPREDAPPTTTQPPTTWPPPTTAQPPTTTTTRIVVDLTPATPPPTFIGSTTDRWRSYPPPEHTTTTRIVVDSPPPTTDITTRTCTYTVYCVVNSKGIPICPAVRPPEGCEVVYVTQSATSSTSVITSPPGGGGSTTPQPRPTSTTPPPASPIVSGRTSAKPEPVPTTPDNGAGGGSSNNNGSPPVDYCVDCTGAANSKGTTVQRGDVAYGQPQNFNNVPNTVAAGSDGTVTKTYDNGDVKISNSSSSSESTSGSSSSSSSSGSSGGTSQITGVAGNCVNNTCPT